MSAPGSLITRRASAAGRLLAGGAAALALVLTGCAAESEPGAGGSPSAEHQHSPGASAPATPTTGESSPAESPPADANQVVIDITLSDGDQVDPNGQKIDVEQGQTVVLNVTSDRDDEIHVHGDIEVSIPVGAGESTSDSFVAESVGSFEVESHHPNKIIAILNVR